MSYSLKKLDLNKRHEGIGSEMEWLVHGTYSLFRLLVVTHWGVSKDHANLWVGMKCENQWQSFIQGLLPRVSKNDCLNYFLMFLYYT